MKTLTILGRRWFQPTYGNTYNSVSTIIDGALAARLEKEYGYGSAYEDRVVQWLRLNGFNAPEQHANGSNEGLSHWARREGVALHSEVVDVRRERDL